MSVNYTVIFEAEDDGGFHVYCPALPGCHSYGDTKEEALANIREAIEAYLVSLKMDGQPYSVVIQEGEDGKYVVTCPAIEGCYSQGDTIPEALANIKEAIEVCVEV